MSFQY